jgi:hypothetical protein
MKEKMKIGKDKDEEIKKNRREWQKECCNTWM